MASHGCQQIEDHPTSCLGLRHTACYEDHAAFKHAQPGNEDTLTTGARADGDVLPLDPSGN